MIETLTVTILATLLGVTVIAYVARVLYYRDQILNKIEDIFGRHLAQSKLYRRKALCKALRKALW